MINDNTIIDLINMDGKIHILKIITKSFLKRNPEIQQYLINRFKDSQSIQETLYRIYYKIEIRPTCPYCGNPEDLAILEKWKEKSKNSQFFINAINTWTVRDVQKRNKAKENNLKRLEFFEAKFLSKEELLQSIKLAGM